jgi:hypothetical protein
MTWKPANLNEAVIYAKGWNDAVKEAARIAEGFRCGACGMDDKAAAAIRELDRSMQAC